MPSRHRLSSLSRNRPRAGFDDEVPAQDARASRTAAPRSVPAPAPAFTDLDDATDGALVSLFPTLIYSAGLGDVEGLKRLKVRDLNTRLATEARELRDTDDAGRAWCETGYPNGYTSYGSLDRLHTVSPTFEELKRALDRHVRAFAEGLHWDLKGGRLDMTDCWLNVMPAGCAHSFHLHPHAVVSGTYYVETPPAAAGIRFEDPRLSRLMAAPGRRADAPGAVLSHVTHRVSAGQVVLFESWPRHEVPASRLAPGEERISVSFNYHWAS